MGGEICTKIEFNHLLHLNTGQYALKAVLSEAIVFRRAWCVLRSIL